MLNKKIKIVSGIVLGTMTVTAGSGLQNYPKTNINRVLLSDHSNNNIVNESIDVSNVWSYSMFNIGFNSNNTFKITEGSASTNPYYSGNKSLIVTIRNSKGEVLSNEVFKGSAYPSNDVYKALNGKSFSYGDIIQITSNSGAHFNVNGKAQKGSISYEITQEGLKQVNTNITDLKALLNIDGTTIISGKTNPFTNVYINVDNKITSVTSNSSGNFSYEVGNLVQGNQISVTANESIPDQITVEDNLASKPIAGNTINISNVWNQDIFNIGFNWNNTFKITKGGSSTNPYYTGNNSLILVIRNQEGKITYKQMFKGGAYPQNDIYNALNGKAFSYGDSVQVISNSNANYQVNGISEKGTINYEITKNGLKKLNENLTNLQALYNENKETTVTGKTNPNTIVYININNKISTVESNSSGEFTYTTHGLKVGNEIYVTPDNSATSTTSVKYNFNNETLTNSKINLYGNCGSIYKINTISFNPYTMKFMTTIDDNNILNGAEEPNACIFTLYNSNGDVITSKSFSGGDSSGDIANYLNNLSFNYGDYFKISISGMETSFNNGSPKEQDILGMIGKDQFYNIQQPTSSFEGNVLTINSEYNGGVANISILGKTYHAKVENGKATFDIPESVPINSKIIISVSDNGFKTMPQVVYSPFENAQNTYQYNMFRYASIAPGSTLGMKGDDMALTAFEPVPLQFSGTGKISVDLKGNITGSAQVYLNTGSGFITLGTVKANTPTEINVPSSGNIMFDISNIDDKGASISKSFTFKTDVVVKSGYYRQIPVFDNRGFVKIDPSAYTNSAAFLKAIMSPENINHGALIIGDHVRMFVNNVGQSLPSNLNAAQTVNWYNETFDSDNKLNGLSQNAPNQINRFHTNNFFVYTCTTDNSDGWWTGSDGTSAIPGMFKIGLTLPGWVMFHECGHIFDPTWASYYLHSEVYSNMYTQETQINVQGSTSWLFGNSQSKYEDENILPIFKNYYDYQQPQNNITNFGTGLYYFTLMKQYHPDYMAKVATLYRNELYNNTLPYQGLNFFVYAMANIYHQNIIPSLQMWGYNITNQKLISYVINNSNSTLSLVPKNPSFDTYENTTTTPTMILPKIENGKADIEGIANPNTTIYAQYGGKTYQFKTNSKGVFNVNLQLIKGLNSTVIYAKEGNKADSLKQTVGLDLNEVLNKQTLELYGCGTNLGSISTNANGTIDFFSNGESPDWYAHDNSRRYMTITLLNPEGKMLETTSISYAQSLDSAQTLFNNMKYQNGDIIKINTPTYSGGENAYLTSLKNGSNAVSPILNNAGDSVYTFVLDNNNIYSDMPLENQMQKLEGNIQWAQLKEAQGIYTKESLASLQKVALEAQNFLNENKYPAESKVIAYNNMFSQAFANLKYNFTTLKSYINDAKIKLNDGNYTSTTKQALETAITKATALINSKNVTPLDISVAEENIVNSMNALVEEKSEVKKPSESKPAEKPQVKKPSESKPAEKPEVEKPSESKPAEKPEVKKHSESKPVEKPEAKKPITSSTDSLLINQQRQLLKVYINSADNALQNGMYDSINDYTQKSTNNFEKIINNAKIVLENKNSTSSQLEAQIQNILNGFRGLEITKIPLENDVKIATEKINKNIYTKDSEQALSSAITDADKILKEEKPTVDAIKNAQEEILNAIKNLKVVEKSIEKPVDKNIKSTSSIKNTITKIPSTTISSNINNNDSLINNIENRLKNFFDGLSSLF